MKLDEVNIKTEVKASNESQSVTLRWKPISGASGYKVSRKRLSDNETDIITIMRGETWIDIGVELCNRYEYSVVPIDESGFACAKTSTITVFVSDGREVSDSVSDLSAQLERNIVELEWQGTDGILYYNVYKKNPSGLLKFIASVDECCFTDMEVKACTPFEYAVEGITTSGVTNRETAISIIPEFVDEI